MDKTAASNGALIGDGGFSCVPEVPCSLAKLSLPDTREDHGPVLIDTGGCLAAVQPLLSPLSLRPDSSLCRHTDVLCARHSCQLWGWVIETGSCAMNLILPGTNLAN